MTETIIKTKNQTKLKLVIDIAIFIAFLIAMDPRSSGIAAHEWLAVSALAAIVIHLLLSWDWIIQINVMGVVNGCRMFVPAMVDRGHGGHVVNLSSAAGYFPNPSLAAYSATKFAVLGLSEALRVELGPSGIGVTAVCPGLINTPITRSSRLRGSVETQRERIVRLYERRNYGPERVAQRILYAVQRDRAVMPVTAEAWGMWWLARFAPPLARGAARAIDAAGR